MTPEQMTALAARLQKAANERGNLPDDSEALAADLDAAADLIDSMAQRVPQSVRERWNIERDKDGTLLVCFNEHEKGLGCRYERFAPESAQRVPLSEEQIYQVIEAARESYRAHTTGIRGQMLTIYDDMDWHLVRAVEQAHGIRSEE